MATIRDSKNHTIPFTKDELRLKKYNNKKHAAILFVVDSSFSQGAKERLSFAKGAVMAMLSKAYSDRDRVGMIVFGDKKAQQILPFTKSVDFAAGKMTELKAKGNTPLSMGIRLAVNTMENDMRKYPDDMHIIVLLTDGKSNYDTLNGKNTKLVVNAAEQVKKSKIPMLVIDTEKSIFGMGLAKEIADKAVAYYVSL